MRCPRNLVFNDSLRIPNLDQEWSLVFADSKFQHIGVVPGSLVNLGFSVCEIGSFFSHEGNGSVGMDGCELFGEVVLNLKSFDAINSNFHGKLVLNARQFWFQQNSFSDLSIEGTVERAELNDNEAEQIIVNGSILGELKIHNGQIRNSLTFNGQFDLDTESRFVVDSVAFTSRRKRSILNLGEVRNERVHLRNLNISDSNLWIDSDPLGINYDNVVWPTSLKQYEGRRVDLLSLQALFRKLKQNCFDNKDEIQGRVLSSLELEAHYKSLMKARPLVSFSELLAICIFHGRRLIGVAEKVLNKELISRSHRYYRPARPKGNFINVFPADWPLTFSFYSNEFGRNWLLAFAWLIDTSIVIFVAIVATMADDFDGLHTLGMIQQLWKEGVFFQFLLPTHSFTLFANYNFSGAVYLLDALQRLTSTYLIFQLVRAFRFQSAM